MPDPLSASVTEVANRRVRPCAILTSFYFHPSNEVASRRMAAIARAIEAEGLDVLVVSAFGNHEVDAGEPLWPGIVAMPVRNPPRLLVGLLVRLKRLFRSRSRNEQDDPAAAERAVAAWTPNARPGDGWVAHLRAGLFRTLSVVDSNKKWGWLVRRQALQAAAGRDVRIVFASGPPFSAVVSAWSVARKLHVPLVADLRDPLATRGPDNEVRSGLNAWILQTLERRLVHDAAAVTCASPGISSAVTGRYPEHAAKVHLVMNGYDGEAVSRPPETGHRLNLLFAGALYLNRDPFPVLEALERLLQQSSVDASRIRLRFIGDCAGFGGVRLADWLADKRARLVVEVLPPVSEAELRPFIDEATVLLNLAQGQPRQIPAKTFEHLASGREILTLCEADSDTGRLLDSVPGVFRVTPGDAAALDRVLEDLYQRHVVEGRLRPIAPEDVARFSRRAQTDRLMEIVRGLDRPDHRIR